jgi:DNA-binding response OmpR family regulator
MQHLALLEDDYEFAKIISEDLEHHFRITHFPSSNRILEADPAQFNAVLFDIHLNQEDGVDIAQKLLNIGFHPLLALSSDRTVQTKVRALQLRIADYLSKDMEKEEIIARIENAIHLGEKTKGKTPTRIGNLTLHSDLLVAEIGGKMIELSRTEFLLLNYLAQYVNRKISRQELTQHAWGDRKLSSGNLSTHLYNLSHKLEGWDYTIQSQREVGIQLVAKNGTAST